MASTLVGAPVSKGAQNSLESSRHSINSSLSSLHRSTVNAMWMLLTRSYHHKSALLQCSILRSPSHLSRSSLLEIRD